MSLNAIMNIATSGMGAAQTQLRVVSDNVSNVNTPGYIRKLADQESVANQGVGAGVEVSRIRLATDRFLQVASLNAASDAGRMSVQNELYDNIQNLFGDPGGVGFFTQIDTLFASFMNAAEDATSGPLRQEAIYKLQTLFDESSRISKQIQSVRSDADGRLVNAVSRTNELLQQIESLNNEIAKAAVVRADATGAQTAQNTLLGELSGLMDIRISQRNLGGVEIRTGAGILLAGQGAATLSYSPAGAVNAHSSFDDIWVTEPSGQKKSLSENLTSGELKGLLTVRDVDAPQAAERLAELTSRLVDQLNAAHNASTSLPAPSVMSGRNTGMSLDTALANFTGSTTIAVVDSEGRITDQTTINFPISSADFLANMATGLPDVSVTFVNGALTLATTGGGGLAISDNAQKGDRGFSHFFGLNDLIKSNQPSIFDGGLLETSEHGFTAGETITFRFAGPDGTKLRDLEVAIPAGGQMSDLISALNDPVTGARRLGTFGLVGGELVFTPNGDPPAKLSVIKDTTTHTASGLSMSQLFGLGGSRAARAESYSVRSDIVQDGNKLALAQLQLGVPATTPAISKNDGRGGQALSNVGQSNTRFSAAGTSAAGSMSISRYAAEFSGEIGSKASNVRSKAVNASAILSEALSRRTAVEGVNLDEELVKMTTFQQAYNASARLIQAVSEMYDTLLGMVR